MSGLTSGFTLIDRYGLSSEVIRLSKEGKTLREIASFLCEHPAMVKDQQTISHTAVGNWLERERTANEQLTRSVTEEVVRSKVVADLGVLDTLVEDLMAEYNKKYETVEDLGLFGKVRKNVPLPFERKVALANTLRQLVGDRLKLAGLGEGGSGGSIKITLADILPAVELKDNGGVPDDQ